MLGLQFAYSAFLLFLTTPPNCPNGQCPFGYWYLILLGAFILTMTWVGYWREGTRQFPFAYFLGVSVFAMLMIVLGARLLLR
jgi:hypothetical protein